MDLGVGLQSIQKDVMKILRYLVEGRTYLDLIIIIIGLTQICLYFVFPPTVIIAMHCWMRKQRKKALDQSGGMSAIRESAKREMMQSIYLQISVYLLSFWSIWVPGLINNVYTVLTGEMIYNLQILANCIYICVLYATADGKAKHCKGSMH